MRPARAIDEVDRGMPPAGRGVCRVCRWRFGWTLALWLVPLTINATDLADGSEVASVVPPADADVATLRAALDTGELTPKRLMQRSLGRIEALDRNGLELNSLVAVDPRAALRDRNGGSPNGMLAGIPVVIGDMIDVAGLPTTAGSVTLRGHLPLADAPAIAVLRAAGALLFAKANTRELGLTQSRSGYSSAGGQTLNPYRQSRVASGAAAAVAAGLAPVGIASDGGGDLRVGAAHAGLVAIRPTRGLVSRDGMLPAPLSLDIIGPLARTLEDAAIVLGVIAQTGPKEAADPVEPDAYRRTARDGAGAEVGDRLKGTRIGVLAGLRGGNSGVDGAFRDAIGRLQRAGAETVEIELPEGFESGWRDWRALLQITELRDQLNAYLSQVSAGRPDDLQTLLGVSRSPLIRGAASPVDTAALAALEQALEGPGLASSAYLDTLSLRLPAIRAALLEQFDANELQAMAFPTTLCPAPSRLDEYDASYDCDAPDPTLPTGLAAASGLPEVTLPIGLTKRGLPVGLSLMGLPYAETTLIRIAAVLEQVSGNPLWPDDVPRALEDSTD